MKILGKHIYLFMSTVKISPEKIRALAKGRAHIHGDPIRKQTPDPTFDPFAGKGTPDVKD